MRVIRNLLGLGEDPGAPVTAESLAAVFGVLDARFKELDARLAGVDRLEVAVQGLVSMVQFTSRATEKSARATEQQFLDLRAHLTGETDRLARCLREDALHAASRELFVAMLPALDELDDWMRSARETPDRPGHGVLGALRRRLRESFRRAGIAEVPIEPRVTRFDGAFAEGTMYEGDAIEGLAEGTIVDVIRSGYMQGQELIRPAMVTVMGRVSSEVR